MSRTHFVSFLVSQFEPEDILSEDAEALEKIMEKYDKQRESKEEYMNNIEKRTREIVQIAGVEYDEYLKALKTSRAGYSIVKQRDIDETFINS